MQSYKYCNAEPAPISFITTPTDLTLPLSPPLTPRVMEVFQSATGRPSPIPHLPVLIVHRQFLKPGAAEELNNGRLNKAFQISIARDAFAALFSRSQYSRICTSWLQRFSHALGNPPTPQLFGSAHRSGRPHSSKTNATSLDGDISDRPFLLICIAAPPSGVLIHSPGYPDSAIRIFSGDAILCPALGDETHPLSREESKEAGVRYLRVHGDPLPRRALFGDPPRSPSASASTSPPDPGSSHYAERRLVRSHFEQGKVRTEAQKMREEAKQAKAAAAGASVIRDYEVRIAALEAGLAVEKARAALNAAVQLQANQEHRVGERRRALIQAEENAKAADRAQRELREAMARDEAGSSRVMTELAVAGNGLGALERGGKGDGEKGKASYLGARCRRSRRTR